jgi:hypothetical protein
VPPVADNSPSALYCGRDNRNCRPQGDSVDRPHRCDGSTLETQQRSPRDRWLAPSSRAANRRRHDASVSTRLRVGPVVSASAVPARGGTPPMPTGRSPSHSRGLLSWVEARDSNPRSKVKQPCALPLSQPLGGSGQESNLRGLCHKLYTCAPPWSNQKPILPPMPFTEQAGANRCRDARRAAGAQHRQIPMGMRSRVIDGTRTRASRLTTWCSGRLSYNHHRVFIIRPAPPGRPIDRAAWTHMAVGRLICVLDAGQAPVTLHRFLSVVTSFRVVAISLSLAVATKKPRRRPAFRALILLIEIQSA